MSAVITRTVTETFERLTCGKCGINFYVPKEWKASKLRDTTNRDFSCPNGCPRRFMAESWQEKAERLERELNTAKEANAFTKRRLADTQERQNRELKRIERRAKAGVCQFCHRTFQNVAKHVHTKHADAEL